MIIPKAGLFSVSDVPSLKIVFPMKSFFGMIILKTRLFSEIGERGRQKLGKQDSFDFTVPVNDYLKISVAKFSHNLSADTAGHDTVF